jgi:hypothetical protein
LSYNGSDDYGGGVTGWWVEFCKISGGREELHGLMKNDQNKELSERSAFRFRCSKEPVTYRTAYDEGEALLKNISTSGCALEWATNPPEADEKILLSIELEGEDSAVEIQARVVRVEDKDFAVKFLLIEPSAKTRIRSYFSRKSRGK